MTSLWLSLSLAVLLDAGHATSAGTPPATDLLFSSNRDGNSEIYVIRSGRGEWTRLTEHDAVDNWPVWSPDGKRIAFQSRRQGNLDIWVMAADGSDPRQLTSDAEPDYLPAWSPDGRSILFTSWRREVGDTARAPHLYLMNADGTEQRRLVPVSLNSSEGATWSPDGKWIVFARKVGRGADLYLADQHGNQLRRITHDGTRNIYSGSPTFSPDGRSIAFYADDGKSAALVVIGRNGKGRRTLVAEGYNWYPRWSSDSQWLVFTTRRPGAAKDDIDVMAVSVEGGLPIPLVGGATREQEGSWRP